MKHVKRRAGQSFRSNHHAAGGKDGWNLDEGLRAGGAKRRFEAHFISKLTDRDGENGETDSSLDFARDCKYISEEKHAELSSMCADIGKKFGAMMRNPPPFLITDRRSDLRSPC